MLVFRYIMKEVLLTALVVTLLLVVIFLGNQFVRYLTLVAGGKIALNMLFTLMALEAPFLFGYLFPVGLFMGILLALGRLYAENEMTVLFACGFSEMRVLAAVMSSAIIVACIVASLVMWAGPLMMRYQEKTMALQAEQLLLQTISPGKFQMINGGNTVIYVERLGENQHDWQHVFLAQLQKTPGVEKQNLRWSVTRARTAKQFESEAKQGLAVDEGFRYQGQAGLNDYSILQFDRLLFRLPDKPVQLNWHTKSLSTHALWRGKDKNIEYNAEWQWRISMPFSAILLVFLGVPLARVRPRQGKFAKILPAALLYIVYANLLFVARGWIVNGALSPHIGMWVVHLPFLLLGLILFIPSRMWSWQYIKWRAQQS